MLLGSIFVGGFFFFFWYYLILLGTIRWLVGDYSDVPASKPDWEGFEFLVDATCAGATVSSARGLSDFFKALSAG